MKPFKSQQYQKAKPFAGFLPGISGLMGVPMWSFYVNRGQAIAGFGVRDKNGSIMEFYPANLAYTYVPTNGFRTFIKVNGKVYECFKENGEHQSLEVLPHEITLSETLQEAGLKIDITYFTMPNENFASLVREVKITNLDAGKKTIQVIDGLTQMLPSGIDYGGYKAISNLLQSWMQVDVYPNYAFLKLRASTADSSEVSAVDDGHFYAYQGVSDVHYIYDYQLVFEQDTSYQTPYGLIHHDLDKLLAKPQAAVNKVPCAYAAMTFELSGSTTFYGMFGYGKSRQALDEKLPVFDLASLASKRNENRLEIQNITQNVATSSAVTLWDDYVQHCFLDNVLRGGYPLIFETLNGTVAYYVYSRKHGDLERDYNFFSLQPSFFSQGNGAFRDVLQNRRNDLYVEPKIGRFLIQQFAALIQADGYNPLSIEGLTFSFKGDIKTLDTAYHLMLSQPFTPGDIATIAFERGDDAQVMVQTILQQSTYVIQATFGEGYWEDHFTYLLDAVDVYLDVYPEAVHDLLFVDKHPYFLSPARVKSRGEKYVVKNDQVRQYHATHHDHHAPQRGWLKSGETLVTHTLFSKLYTLVLNKFSHLDPDGLALSYEGDKPGWNDAMNGLPGLCGSGVGELFELLRIVRFLTMHRPEQSIAVLSGVSQLSNALLAIDEKELATAFDARMTALEAYRESLLAPVSESLLDGTTITQLLHRIEHVLMTRVGELKKQYAIMPTYFYYDAVRYEKGAQGVQVHEYKRHELPIFLEGPTRYLSSRIDSLDDAQRMYDAVKHSKLKDPVLGLYKTSESLDAMSMELGRIRAFTPGWLERESDFLHMSYKFLFSLLKAELYDAFFDEIQTSLTCFMDPLVYGRSPLENSSFIVTTNNPDSSRHGQGFFARLSGSTAEVLSMWKYMMFGPQLFSMREGVLTFKIHPILPSSFFKDGIVETTLFNHVRIRIHYDGTLPTYHHHVRVNRYVCHNKDVQEEVLNAFVEGLQAARIRDKFYDTIDVYLKGGQ